MTEESNDGLGCVAGGSDEKSLKTFTFLHRVSAQHTSLLLLRWSTRHGVVYLSTSTAGAELGTADSTAIEDSEFSTAVEDGTGQSALVILRGLGPGAQPNKRSQATTMVVPAQRCRSLLRS